MARWAGTVMAAAVAVLALSREADAATIFGAIHQGNRPVVNAPVALVCRGTEAARTTTDARGGYRLTANETGRCTLEVRGGSTEVILYQDPTRYDFDLVGAGGQLRLNRR